MKQILSGGTGQGQQADGTPNIPAYTGNVPNVRNTGTDTLGFEVAEITDVSNVQVTLVFSGLKSARMWLRDDGSSEVTEIYYVLNAASDEEAAARLALADSRLVIRLGETLDKIEFDSDDPVIRIDYIGDAVLTAGANTFYIEGKI